MNETYNQCRLHHYHDNGFTVKIAWIPTKFAVLGKRIVIDDKEWVVEYPSAIPVDGKFIHDSHHSAKRLPSIDKK